jgi:succinyl-CoA synthetase alpha subunit
MAILITKQSRVLVQGITGFQARFEVRLMLDYGTRIVAGVSPGRAGQEVEGVPVFDTIEDALKQVEVDVSVIYAPPSAGCDALAEAVLANIPVVCVATEHLPLLDWLTLYRTARDRGLRIVGPGSQGIVVPGQCRIGGPGGRAPARTFAPGNIGVVSRSGGMGTELSWLIHRNGCGVSTQVHVGGERFPGTSLAEIVDMFNRDPGTERIAIFCELGGEQEEAVAQIAGSSKPIGAIVAGYCGELFGDGMQFGHASNLVEGAKGSARAKADALRSSGVSVFNDLGEFQNWVAAGGKH